MKTFKRNYLGLIIFGRTTVCDKYDQFETMALTLTEELVRDRVNLEHDNLGKAKCTFLQRLHQTSIPKLGASPLYEFSHRCLDFENTPYRRTLAHLAESMAKNQALFDSEKKV